MKVGFLLDDHMHRAGGVQEYVRGMVRYLEARGHEAVVFSGGAQFDAILPERVVCLGRSMPFKGNGSSTSVPLVLDPPWKLRALLEREACDVLHVQSPFSPTMSGRLLAQSRAAHVLSFHIRIDGTARLWALRQLARAQQGSLARIHERIAVSPAALDSAQALYPGDYRLIPVGVDTTAFSAAADRPRLLPYADGRVTLLSFGRLEDRKGVHHLLHAYAILEREHGDRIRLVIAGDGPEREKLQALALSLRLRHVEWLGYVTAEDLPHVVASADVFCAPATGHESFGYVLIEAMAAALPIVAFGNAGYAGVLANHPGNFVVPVGNRRQFAAATNAYIVSPALRRTIGDRNRAAAARYGWDIVGDEVFAVYEAALATKMQRIGS